MSTTEILELGRVAFDRSLWGEAFARLSAADRNMALAPEDLERLAVAAHLVGEDEASTAVWERAHRQLLERGEVVRAVRSAFWLIFGLLHRGEMARAGGWLARAQRLLDDHQLDCVERGYLLIPVATRTMNSGDPWSAHGTFSRAAELGARFAEPDLVTLGQLGQGMSLIRMGRTAEGLTLLDEAMIAVVTEEVSALVAGKVYCFVILAGQEVFDLRRAHEWAAALSDWCDGQPDLVPFRGQCLVHRSEILQLHGEWPKAMGEVERARERLSDPPRQPALGMAYYQQGELYRLRGEFAAAEEAYRQAARWGREPHPGLALLWLAQGNVEASAAAIRRVVDGAQALNRARMLPAYVEIMLAADDGRAARDAADELADIAADLDAPLLEAMSATATGMVLLEEGDPQAALGASHRACTGWRELEAPYEYARAQVLVGRACRALGDQGTGELELAAAQQVFQQLGAAPDRERVKELFVTTTRRPPGGPTARELEVLTLVAEGETNRDIAAKLSISEHTVRRHLQNLFRRLGVSSRAAATAYALEHDLI
ncbi:MAG: LuxR C-terminal-related transcriptional regulator [Actinomycetota bacterium]|nr:LuxR C-terminal-related transcriptional regulator [Actinomycetota bacterium]